MLILVPACLRWGLAICRFGGFCVYGIVICWFNAWAADFWILNAGRGFVGFWLLSWIFLYRMRFGFVSFAVGFDLISWFGICDIWCF